MIPSILVFIRRTTCSVFSVLCNFLKHGRRARVKKPALVLFLGILVFVLVYFGFYFKRPYFKPVTKRNLEQYCNFPANAHGIEGKLPNEARDMKLEIVNILIRHGDRRPIYHLEGLKKRNVDCSGIQSDSSSKKMLEDYLKSLKYISTRPASPKAVIHNLSPSSDMCDSNGQMTPQGFQQLIAIGKYLSKAYCRSDLDVIKASNVYARSTNFDRTAQTVAAILSGFLGDKINSLGHIAINITKDTFFREDDVDGLKSCPATKKKAMDSKMSTKFDEGMAAMEPFMQQISDMLLMTRESLPTISFIADHPLVHFCHGLRYPCGINGCFSEQTTLSLLSYSDWYFNAKYKQFSHILSLPVLTEIGSRMLSKVRSQSPIKLAIYGGHESSIIPVLQSLGVYDERWIPYASRLVFELWTKTNENNFGGKFIRVLFNGDNVTNKLSFCKRKVIHNGELCPLRVFLDWIGGGHFENAKQRYYDLCHK